MRPIKFRAWYTGSSLKRGMYDVISISWGIKTLSDNIDTAGCVFVELAGHKGTHINLLCKPTQIVLMQYTGLKDKEGVEIYEGDIVKVDYLERFKNARPFSQIIHGSDPYVEKTWGRYASFCAKTLDMVPKMFDESSLTYGLNILNELLAKYCNVIGNIYENPELMEMERDRNNL